MQRIVKRPTRAGAHRWTHRIRQTVGIAKSGTDATPFMWMKADSGSDSLRPAKPVHGWRIAKRSRWKAEYDCAFVAASKDHHANSKPRQFGHRRNRGREPMEARAGMTAGRATYTVDEA